MQPTRVALAVVAVLAGCGRDGGLAAKARESGRQRADQARGAARAAGLPDDVAGVIADAAGAVGRAFTVTYDTGGGGRATLVQDPPRRRFDLAVPGSATRATLLNEQGSFACEQRAATWACVPSPEPPPDVGPFAATDLERTIGSLATARATYDLRVERRRLAGTDARCLVTERKPAAAGDPALGERGTLCVAPSGAALDIDQPSQRLTAVDYADRADPAAFALPGPLATTTVAPPPTR
ncbi:MAG: hypothetical protein ABIS47_06530 [Acidimicrobiales bacterium]